MASFNGFLLPFSCIHIHVHTFKHVVIVVVPDVKELMEKMSEFYVHPPVVVVSIIVAIVEIVVDVHDCVDSKEDEGKESKSIKSCLSRTCIPARSSCNIQTLVKFHFRYLLEGIIFVCPLYT